MDYQVFLIRLPGYTRPTRNISRMLRVHEHGISISSLSPLNPISVEYSLEAITKLTTSPTDSTDFTFDVLENGVETSHTFSCNTREKLLTTLFNKLDDLNGIGTDYNVKKYSYQRGSFLDVVMRLRSTSIVKMVAAGVRSERRKASNTKQINLQDILRIETIGDDGSEVLLHMKSRTMRLSLGTDSLQFASAIQQHMKMYLSREMAVEITTTEAMSDLALARAAMLRSSPVLYEFAVVKGYDVSGIGQRERALVITSDYLAELAGEEIIGLHSLSDIIGIVVGEKNEMEVIVEFREWRPTQYFITDRESFLGSFCEVMGLVKGTQFSLRLEHFFTHTLPEKPLPLYQNECEIFFISRFMTVFMEYRDLHQLASSKAQALWFPLLKDYACNIHLGDSLCIDARPLYAVADVLKASLTLKPGLGASYAVTACIVLQRLLASRACFDSIKSNPEFAKLLIMTSKLQNPVVAYSAAVTLRCALKLYVYDGEVARSSLAFLGSAGPASVEAANKQVVLSQENLQILVAHLQTHAVLHQNALQVLGILEIISLALKLPPLDPENERIWLQALEESLMTASDVLSMTCRSRSPILFRTNALLLQTALEKSSQSMTSHLQQMCVVRCVLLLHLRAAVFSKNERQRQLSGQLVYILVENNPNARTLVFNVLPKGFGFIHWKKLEELKEADMVATTQELKKSKSIDALKRVQTDKAVHLAAWLETLEMLRVETMATPIFVWNDLKRQELQKFLWEEVESFDAAVAASSGHDVCYNSDDVQLLYSPASENNELVKTIVDNVHLEILVAGPPEGSPLAFHWQLGDPVPLFLAVLNALQVCFTPLYGSTGLPEVEPRLAMDTLMWIYERHPKELESTMDNLCVVEILVAMLREAVENEHHVFAFKALFFLLLTMELGGRRNGHKLVKAGAIATLIPLMVASLARTCRDVTLVESDYVVADEAKMLGGIEKVPVVGADGDVRMARVPNGRHLDSDTVTDGSVSARDAIRWQDDSVPDKLQLGLILDLLETLLRLSGQEGSVEQFPPSAAAQELTRHEILFHIVQILLRVKSPMYHRVLKILSILAKANPTAASGLYKFGLFEILMWKLLAGDITDRDKLFTMKFLWQSHLNQRPGGMQHAPLKGIIPVEHVPWQNSYLRLFLPEGLVAKLILEGPEVVKNLLQQELNLPEVIWTEEMRATLLDRLSTDLEFYVKARASDPHAVFIYSPKPPVSYVELQDKVFLAPVYLENLLDVDRFPTHQLADPSAFHTAVLQEYQRILGLGQGSEGGPTWRTEVPRIELLTRAQCVVLERHTHLPLDSEAERLVIEAATPALRVCIAQPDDCPPSMTRILANVSKILRFIASTRDKDVEVSKNSVNFALSVLSLGTRVNADGSPPDPAGSTTLEPALINALGLLEHAAATREGRLLLRDDIRWRKGFWWALCSSAGHASSSPDNVPSPVAFTALDCLNHFSRDLELSYRVLKQALLLPLLLLAIPTEAALAEERQKDGVGAEGNHQAKALQQVAAEVLRTLAVTLDQAPEADPSPRMQFQQGILANIIPLALLMGLKNPDAGAAKFLAMASSEVDGPTGIWNREVRMELRTKVEARMKEVNLAQATGGISSDEEIMWLRNFRYHALRGEIVIEGIFVAGYATGDWQHFDLPDGRAFLDSLQDYLEANRHVLISDESERQDATTKAQKAAQVAAAASGEEMVKAKEAADEEAFLMAIGALGECLRYAVEDGKRGMLQQVRYPLLSEVLMRGQHLPNAQLEVAHITQVLAGHPTSRVLLLSSELLSSMAVKLWQYLAAPAGTVLVDVSSAILDALLALCEEMPATLEATNHIADSGFLILLIALFCNIPLPQLKDSSENQPEASANPPAGTRQMAAQLLGQLLLAAAGVDGRAKLMKDLANMRSLGTDPEVGGPEAGLVDMYELTQLLEPQQQQVREVVEVRPAVVRSLFKLLPLHMLSALARDPLGACHLYDSDACTPIFVWNDMTRSRTRGLLVAQLAHVSEQASHSKPLRLPGWVLGWNHERPVFLGFVAAVVSDNVFPPVPLFSDSPEEGYVDELYLGGFYLDQLLRHATFQMDEVAEERMMLEVRKAVVVAAPSTGMKANAFSFDDRRRLLLTLLLLFRGRPHLLGTSNLDIFLPLYDFLAGGSEEEYRGLVQANLLLFYCTVRSADVADFVVTEDLLTLLASLLALRVPPAAEGQAGTDPRMCALMLLLRLVRLSSTAVATALALGLVPKLASIVQMTDAAFAVRNKAAVVLQAMTSDKRHGGDVSKAVERCKSERMRHFRAWEVLPPGTVPEDEVDEAAVQFLLRHRWPAPWWVSSVPEGVDDVSNDGAMLVVEATVKFPNASLDEFNDEMEGLFRHCAAAAADVTTSNVRILRKIAGSVHIDFEVQFHQAGASGFSAGGLADDPEARAQAFRDKLEGGIGGVFSGRLFEPLGVPVLRSLTVRSWGAFSGSMDRLGDGRSPSLGRALSDNASQSSPGAQTMYQRSHVLPSALPPTPGESQSDSWSHREGQGMSQMSSPLPSITYAQGEHTPESLIRGSALNQGEGTPGFVSKQAQRPPPPLTNGNAAYSSLVPPAQEPPPPSPAPPAFRPRVCPLLPCSSQSLSAPPLSSSHPRSPAPASPPPPSPPPPRPLQGVAAYCTLPLVSRAYSRPSPRPHSTLLSFNAATCTSPALASRPLLKQSSASSPAAVALNSSVINVPEEGRLVPRGTAIDLVLENADTSNTSRAISEMNPFNAFKKEEEKLESMLQTFPKVFHKYPLQDQPCDEAMAASEESYPDQLTCNGQGRYMQTFTSFGTCLNGAEVAAAVVAENSTAILTVRKNLV